MDTESTCPAVFDGLADFDAGGAGVEDGRDEVP
jgi:hypothetical protein